ncbi:MAG TPA: cation:proton antiporter [Euryarchaeota archaeon]|nr:cation:proton antiporter [Euryarchaeota archaeon]
MFVLICIALILDFIRAILGPTGPDRIVAMDTMTTVTVGLLVLLAYYYGRAIYIDVAFVYAILSFVGILAIARYLEAVKNGSK